MPRAFSAFSVAAPTLLVEARPERSRQLRRRRSGGSAAGGSDESGSSSSEGEEEGEDCFTGSGSSGAADWQVRRSKSWDGHLQDTATLGDSLPLVGCPVGGCLKEMLAGCGWGGAPQFS